MTPAIDSRLRSAIWLIVISAITSAVLVACAAPPRPEVPPVRPAPDSKDPKAWQALYPVEYDRWLATSQPRPAGLSEFKRGFDGGITFDKLSELPFMPLLFNGWGFGVEYNEPRGHWWMLRDQQEVDHSRVKAGGACLTCKSPYSNDLHAKYGEKMMGMPYDQALQLIPAGQRDLGVSCVDCHDNKTLELRSPRWTMKRALADIKLSQPNAQQQRIIVCGQCHCTYSVMKKDGVSTDVNYPWQGGSWGDIKVEDVIAMVESSASSELFSLLKRQDEKHVTEKAYANPMFVEDVVREIAHHLSQDKNFTWYAVESENFESIHNHSAYAYIESKNSEA